ncbi:MAG: ABC transporter permease, partial [Lutibacter sp.]
MKTILFIIQKEFKQIFRNKGMLPIIFIMPFIQLIILSNAASFEIKNIKFSYIDFDHSTASREIIQKIKANRYFNIVQKFDTRKAAVNSMQKGKVDVILEIPNNFEKDLLKNGHNNLSATINAIDGMAAGIENVYLTQMVQQYNNSLRIQYQPFQKRNFSFKKITTIPSFWYNKTLNYKTYMVPGILVLLVTMITLFLSGMNIVREKEIGTLEQINVTPIKKHQFIIGKLFPFWILGLILLTVGLVIAKLLFNVPIIGNVFLLYLFTSIYILIILGIGLFIS